MKTPLLSFTPDIVISDAIFCEKLPKPFLVAFAGIDAITHAAAPVSVAANEFTEGHGLRAFKLLMANLTESSVPGYFYACLNLTF